MERLEAERGVPTSWLIDHGSMTFDICILSLGVAGLNGTSLEPRTRYKWMSFILASEITSLPNGNPGNG